MKVNGKLALALSAAGVLAFTGGAALTHAARAAGGAAPDVNCASGSPCLVENNTLAGAGMKGSSFHGSGVLGTTQALGTTSTNGRNGLWGQDLQITSGKGFDNNGVLGTSTNGVGVRGTSTNGNAIVGTSTNANGVIGNGSSGGGDGVAGFGFIGTSGQGHEGAEGTDLGGSTDTAVFANGLGGRLFRGNNSSAVDVFIVDNAGNTTMGGHASIGAGASVTGSVSATSVSASAGSGIAVSGSGSIGVDGSGTEGVEGCCSGTDNLFANSFSSSTNFIRGNNHVGANTFIVDDAGNVFAHSFNATTIATVAQRTATGQRISTYMQRASQPTLEDFGEAQLVGGVANVRLSPSFSSAIDRNSNYLVMVTPEGDCRGLYVAQKTAQGFTIRELQGGRSSIAFSYRIVAKPFGPSGDVAQGTPRMPAGFDSVTYPKVRPQFIAAPVLHLTHTPKVVQRPH